MASVTQSGAILDPSASAAIHPQTQHEHVRNILGNRGRGGPRGSHNNDSARGGGRRGGRGTRRHPPDGDPNQRAKGFSNSVNPSAPPLPPPPGLGRGGSFGGRLIKDAETKDGEEGQELEDIEAEVCFICASPVVHNSVAPCNHRTCHICALKLRALYKTRACAHCRTEAKFVVFTDDPTKRHEDFVENDFQTIDEVLGIKYEQKEIYNDTVLLLRYNCPDDSCDIACWGWPDLHRHVKSTHHKVLCDLCTRNKKVFTHEHELFTQQELRKHEKFGDDNPGAVDQSGFKGHPECGFCRQRFYGDDELYTHCRDKHEKCHICDRRNPARQQQYYVDYNSLEEHFRKDHFLCADKECMDKKFVVFDSEMDLKAHQLEAHPNGLTKGRDARRVDISTFEYRTPHQDDRGGRRDRDGRDGRGRGRGRDPNTEALPHSTGQPLRRDEFAYQRQVAIQTAQSATTRIFDGQLTSTVPRGQTTTNSSFPAIDSLHLNSSANDVPASPQSTPTLTPHEQARRAQHNAVMDRASAMLKHDSTKISDFRSSVSSYRASSITASQLIDSFFSYFDVPSTDLAKLIKELADIYENEAKRNGLLKAWNDWRAINEDYPSLPGPSGVLPGSSAAVARSGDRRVLTLKSSTLKSSTAQSSHSGSWGNVTNADPFPSMPVSSANRAGAGRVGVAPSSSRPLPAPSQPTSKPPGSGNSNGASAVSFPALPAAPKPNTLIAGLTRGTVRWDDGRSSTAPTNPWRAANGTGGSGSTTPVNAATAAGGALNEEAESSKKGNKTKKQTLYRFG